MFPSEMVILMAITVAGEANKKRLNRPMDVTGEYIGYLYDSLIKRGYLKENSSRGYQLTSKGRQAIFEFLHKNKAKVRAAIKTLQQLGIEISQEIDKPEKATTKVK